MALRGASYAATFPYRGFVSTASPAKGLQVQTLKTSSTKGLQVQTLEPGTPDEIAQEDLQQFYQEINRESFAGKLPDVPVRWGDLTADDAYGITHFQSGVPYAMELDRQTVKSKSFALDVIRHESCHIATNGEAKRRKENPHGATFVACMARIQDSEKGD